MMYMMDDTSKDRMEEYAWREGGKDGAEMAARLLEKEANTDCFDLAELKRITKAIRKLKPPRY